MIEYLTPADLDALTDAITAAEAGDTVAQYLLASDGAMSRLIAQARLALTIPEREAQAREEGIEEAIGVLRRLDDSYYLGYAIEQLEALLATPEASDERVPDGGSFI